MEVIKCLMRSFELVSGLKVNFFKSNFGAFGVEERVMKIYVALLNCRCITTPFVYLGIPIGENPRSQHTWKSVTSKFQKKLAIWNHKLFL